MKPDNITNIDFELLKQKYKNINKIIKKLNKNYPVQYLIGNVNFYGYTINVNRNVLIPRFETETLVEKTINYLKKYHLVNEKVLEIGTGSGCISIALKKEIPTLYITSLDKSKKALKVAKKNILLNNTEINLIKKNIFKYKPKEKFTILISNPPYIGNEPVDISTKYEPKSALYAKNDGLEFYEYILKNYNLYLQDKFFIALEIGAYQGKKIIKIAKKYISNAKISLEKDLTGKDRYIFINNL